MFGRCPVRRPIHAVKQRRLFRFQQLHQVQKREGSARLTRQRYLSALHRLQAHQCMPHRLLPCRLPVHPKMLHRSVPPLVCPSASAWVYRLARQERRGRHRSCRKASFVRKEICRTRKVHMQPVRLPLNLRRRLPCVQIRRRHKKHRVRQVPSFRF